MKPILISLTLALSLYAAEHNHAEMNMQNVEITSQLVLDAMHGPMAGVSMSCNSDIDFLSDMIPHHQGAIDSSKLYLQIGKNDELKKIANNIIKTQQDEIDYFNELIDTLTKEAKKDCESKDYELFQVTNKDAMDKMMEQMSKVTASNNADNDFAKAMIEHHKGAIKSAQLILKYTKNPQVQDIANNIIKAQEDEIKTMQGLIK